MNFELFLLVDWLYPISYSGSTILKLIFSVKCFVKHPRAQVRGISLYSVLKQRVLWGPAAQRAQNWARLKSLVEGAKKETRRQLPLKAFGFPSNAEPAEVAFSYRTPTTEPQGPSWKGRRVTQDTPILLCMFENVDCLCVHCFFYFFTYPHTDIYI